MKYEISKISTVVVANKIEAKVILFKLAFLVDHSVRVFSGNCQATGKILGFEDSNHSYEAWLFMKLIVRIWKEHDEANHSKDKSNGQTIISSLFCYFNAVHNSSTAISISSIAHYHCKQYCCCYRWSQMICNLHCEQINMSWSKRIEYNKPTNSNNDYKTYQRVRANELLRIRISRFAFIMVSVVVEMGCWKNEKLENSNKNWKQSSWKVRPKLEISWLLNTALKTCQLLVFFQIPFH